MGGAGDLWGPTVRATRPRWPGPAPPTFTRSSRTASDRTSMNSHAHPIGRAGAGYLLSALNQTRLRFLQHPLANANDPGDCLAHRPPSDAGGFHVDGKERFRKRPFLSARYRATKGAG